MEYDYLEPAYFFPRANWNIQCPFVISSSSSSVHYSEYSSNARKKH